MCDCVNVCVVCVLCVCCVYVRKCECALCVSVGLSECVCVSDVCDVCVV